jgi:hypothetical protein
MAGGGRIEPWMVQEVIRYLGKAFPGARVDDYPRGGAVAHLFTVVEAASDPRKRQRHNLIITRHFFERCHDPATLRDALEGAEVARALTRAGDRTVDLH